jgi:predicted Zn-dependent protease
MQDQKQVQQKQFRRQTQKLKRTIALSLVLASHQFLLSGIFDAASADTISPHITSGGKVYSEEKPNREFFGSGMSGRLSEASHLRFTGEQALDDGDLNTALKKLSKAVQLDPGDPTGHLMYARAMTSKINRALKRGEEIDADLMSDCIDEWKLIWRHDADTSEQAEAKAQGRRLLRISKLMYPQEESRFAKLLGKGRPKLASKNKPKLATRDVSKSRDADEPKSDDLEVGKIGERID